METAGYFKGRGAQVNTGNPFLKSEYTEEHVEGLDESLIQNKKTTYIYETPKKIINKVNSPDIGSPFSLNPYQGCEHGCAYCYARNSHQYWGLSAGLDFERKIMVKKNAPELLEKQFLKKSWRPFPVMLSGNTDCYQPVERELGITRELLKVFLKYKHPVGIITKNSLILRDMDIISELARHDLVHVSISITGLNEKMRRKLEPRTAAYKKRFEVINALSQQNVPVNVMVAPVIPGLNSHQIPKILRLASEYGASSAAYTMVRLNGSVADVFEDWIKKSFPDSAEKVLNLIRQCHNGKLSDSRFGKRMRGDGNVASSIAELFKVAKSRHFEGKRMRPYNLNAFSNGYNEQLKLFGT